MTLANALSAMTGIGTIAAVAALAATLFSPNNRSPYFKVLQLLDATLLGNDEVVLIEKKQVYFAILGVCF